MNENRCVETLLAARERVHHVKKKLYKYKIRPQAAALAWSVTVLNSSFYLIEQLSFK